ncbi:TPA: hypothetical protein ACHU8I_001334 [Streptococcus suis]|uniref:PTS transporter n=2 Tax=Streptococcus suis TaxID=1307 RepID=A0A0Z8C8I9_STRSU|nr:hypothetical protein [Streptococcus suis]AER18014.1 conserved hypothetical protein [Streptococcus suis D9]AML45923.1 hypothetical protein APQ97_02185 [Streptococcus suis]MBL1132540.1 hypothetical protein [Streptococcus suis]MBM6437016.1 hypothetical protein [Streptococcus suis]MBO8052309.1 hypothetical protein [Streptococcus suis]
MSKGMASKKLQKTPEQLKQESKRKSQLFNRYMLFRYSLAVFFFANLYWLLVQLFQPSLYLILPSLMLIAIIIATAEQFKLYSAEESRLTKTEFVLRAQAILQGLIVVLVILGHISTLFPTFSNHISAKLFVIALQLLGLALVVLNIKRLEQVRQNTDKYYLRFQIIRKYL